MGDRQDVGPLPPDVADGAFPYPLVDTARPVTGFYGAGHAAPVPAMIGRPRATTLMTFLRKVGKDTNMSDDPFTLFDRWFAEARDSEPNDPNAMALATADARGRPSVRMVLLKGHGAGGFVFYTNRGSRKAGDLAANAQAGLLFHWKSLRRQVRIEGAVTHAGDAESDAYFATRGRDSQLGAWASEQSQPLDGRATFEARFEEMKARFDGQDVPRPPNWGGYRVTPDMFEFWHDRAHRLHERRVFTRAGGGWSEGLLFP